ncbi:unnamed protein product [Rotaria sp. Silwood1]|nr:unnamed protein product [Rotaria sp. Silwood1]CAF1589995.1 unnamed protein product [Rotaria sp. Silwood1]CAF3719948.1 unnamed protein product [Rotaria sp. Silwood1]CAF3725564.1 unnamed protein product [Rotaria sp. Silwood1]CAF3768364.1 unnamed protein product [Rotaria sp. Silwood1]
MTNQHRNYVTNLFNVNLIDYNSTNILDDEFKNSMEILIAECIGTITKNYYLEYQRLTAFAFYPPLNHKQICELAIENVTSNDVQNRINEKVYKQLESMFQNKIVKWNSIDQTIAKRFVKNSVQQTVKTMREKLLQCIDHENFIWNIIIQRFILSNNRLKII